MIKQKILKFGNKYFVFITGIIIGFICFLSIYGTSTLNVQYDSWIYNGYTENDIQQHYGGWVNFRNSDWAFPIGKGTNVQYPDGAIISFTDSIPIVSIIFKLFRNFLPETFQFFGLYVLLCFILQAISAGLLLKNFTENKLHIIIGSLIFTISPIMIERSFRHTSLASHWLILLALCIHFKAKKEGFSKFKWQFILLNALTVTIHPYFFPMIMAITFASSLEKAILKKDYIKNILFILLNMAVTIIICFLIGSIGRGEVISISPYGHFSMNVNAIINPTSIGVTNWSRFLRQQEQILGNYDGFNYLGVGALAIGIFIILYFITNNKFKDSLKLLIQCIKNNIGLFLVSIILTLFAISNVITFNGHIILHYPLPDFILNLFSIFRASSRMFYPVFYLIYLSEIIFIFKHFNSKNITVLLVFFILVQVIDLSPALLEKRDYFSRPIINTEFDDEIWQIIAQKTDMVYMNQTSAEATQRKLSIFCGKNHKISDIPLANRQAENSITAENAKKIYQDLVNGENPLGNSYVFITDSEEEYGVILPNLNEELTSYRSGDYKIIIPKILTKNIQ